MFQKRAYRAQCFGAIPVRHRVDDISIGSHKGYAMTPRQSQLNDGNKGVAELFRCVPGCRYLVLTDHHEKAAADPLSPAHGIIQVPRPRSPQNQVELPDQVPNANEAAYSPPSNGIFSRCRIALWAPSQPTTMEAACGQAYARLPLLQPT